MWHSRKMYIWFANHNSTKSYSSESNILAKDHSLNFLQHSSSIIAPTYNRHLLRFVSGNWPLVEINCILIFSAQRTFRTTFSRLGILGSPSWPSGTGLFLGFLIRLPPLDPLLLQTLVYGLQDHTVHRPKLALGKISLDQIKRSHIRDALLNISKKGLSKSSVSMARNVISGTIEYAMEEELVTTNPTNGVLKKLGLDGRNRPLVQPMTADEVSLFLGICSLHMKKCYPLFLCAFRTGMRLGELLGLRWGDIDWNSKSVQVQRSFRHGKLTGTKTRKSRRVDMSDQLVEELRGLLTNRKKEAMATGTGEVVETIFHTGGKTTSQNTIRNIWKSL